MPRLNSSFTRSAPFSAMRLASSCTVIASGTTTSRTCFSRGLDEPPPCIRRSFSRARLSAARLRARRPSSSLSALVTVSLPERRLSGRSAPRAGFSSFLAFFSGFLGSGRATGVNLRAAGRAGVLPLSSSAGALASSSSAAGASAAALASSSARLAASSLALAFSSARFFSSSAACLAFSSSRLRASSASRRRSSSASRWRRATRSCGVSPAGAAFFGAAFFAAGAGAGAGAGVGAGAGAGSGAFASSAGGAVSPGFRILRRRFTSTATLLVRPWLKVCLTSPDSTLRLRPSGLRVRVLFSSSLIKLVSSFSHIVARSRVTA